MEEKTGLAEELEKSSRTVKELGELVSRLQQKEFELEEKVRQLTRQIELIKLIYSPEVKN